MSTKQNYSEISRRLNAEERFWAKVDIGDPNKCHEFTGAKDSSGYGSFWLNGKAVVASRYALILHTGEDRQGEYARHVVCDNPPCCNPAHLEWGTCKDNVQDMIDAGRAWWQRTEEGVEYF